MKKKKKEKMSKNETENNIEFNINVYVPFVVLHSLGSILGIIGSLAVFAAIIVTKEIRNSTNIIIGNIAIADFILSAFVDPLAIAGIYLVLN